MGVPVTFVVGPCDEVLDVYSCGIIILEGGGLLKH